MTEKEEIIEQAKSFMKKGREKDDNIQKQIQFNAHLPRIDTINSDNSITHEKKLIAVDSYSTRFLCVKDQLLLAVDKIAFPEVKDGLYPDNKYRKNEAAFAEWRGLTFCTSFSLNDGDKDAFRRLAENFTCPYGEKYIYRVYVDSIYSGTFDETSTFKHIGKQNKSANAKKLEQTLFNDFENFYIEISMEKPTTNKISFLFDMFDSSENGGISWNPEIPCISITATAQRNTKINKIEWTYDVHICSGSGVLPEPQTMKLYYESAKVLLRSGLADMDISPYFSIIDSMNHRIIE